MKTMSIPAGPEALTAGWLTDALRSTGVIRNAAITSIDTEVIGEGSGFIGQLARVKLSYDRPEEGAPASLIAKFPGASAAGREIGNLFDFYRREICFYEEIAGEVELTTPRLYFSAMDTDAQDYILLLEDMAPARVGDQAAGCTLAEAELAVRSIASFHATWWEHPRLDGVSHWMPVIDASHQSAQQSIPAGVGPFIETSARSCRRNAKDRGADRAGTSSSCSRQSPTAAHHRARRLSHRQLLLRHTQERPPFAVADWRDRQPRPRHLRRRVPAVRGTGAGQRRQHEQRLLKLYHDLLVQGGVTGYAFDQCWTEYRRMALYVFVYVVISLGTLDFANSAAWRCSTRGCTALRPRSKS
jgi:hypothetical protein